MQYSFENLTVPALHKGLIAEPRRLADFNKRHYRDPISRPSIWGRRLLYAVYIRSTSSVFKRTIIDSGQCGPWKICVLTTRLLSCGGSRPAALFGCDRLLFIAVCTRRTECSSLRVVRPGSRQWIFVYERRDRGMKGVQGILRTVGSAIKAA